MPDLTGNSACLALRHTLNKLTELPLEGHRNLLAIGRHCESPNPKTKIANTENLFNAPKIEGVHRRVAEQSPRKWGNTYIFIRRKIFLPGRHPPPVFWRPFSDLRRPCVALDALAVALPRARIR
jgi:hypothetical protein